MSLGILKTTLKIQPAVILFSSVSVLTKLASERIPKEKLSIVDKLIIVSSDWHIWGLILLMFLVLGCYAVIWQRLIKDAQIAIVYANKSTALFWTQLAAVLLFGEIITWKNLLGMIVIFIGILITNLSQHECT